MIPVALTTGPFNLVEARRHGLTKDHLRGASWRRLGGGVYTLRAIANNPDVVLSATTRRLPLVEAVAALDMALHERLLRSDDLRSWVCSHPRYPGLAHLRRTIELAEPATESVMETRLRLLLVIAAQGRKRRFLSSTKPAIS